MFFTISFKKVNFIFLWSVVVFLKTFIFRPIFTIHTYVYILWHYDISTTHLFKTLNK